MRSAAGIRTKKVLFRISAANQICGPTVNATGIAVLCFIALKLNVTTGVLFLTDVLVRNGVRSRYFKVVAKLSEGLVVHWMRGLDHGHDHDTISWVADMLVTLLIIL